MCNTTSTNPIVGNVIGSPMFNLSLSSKELFHSNFLAWLNTYNLNDNFDGWAMVKVWEKLKEEQKN